MFSGCPCVRACVCACVRVCVRACVRASVRPVLARLKENHWVDFHQNFTSEPSRDVLDLIRFWPYKVNFHGNGGAIYGEICLFSMISRLWAVPSPPKFYQ